MIKRLLREPLLHFLVLGAVLFAAHGMLSRGGASEPGRIVVTQSQIESMARLFARARQRAPSDAELEELVRGHVREEVLYREGLALGLDRDDPIIRRRVAQKLEFVTEGAEAVEPDDRRIAGVSRFAPRTVRGRSRDSVSATSISTRGGTEASLAADAERMLAELNSPASQPRCCRPRRSDHAAARL